jgi:2'-5' RNA ligase
MTGLKDAGFKLEDRPYRPHLTLGRIKSLKDTNTLKTALEKYKDKPIQQVNVEEVILYESILKPTGPIYKPEGKYSLL